MSDGDEPQRSDIERRSLELQEGQQPPRHFVRSLFSSVPAEDPFGEYVSVVQGLPEHAGDAGNEAAPVVDEEPPLPAEPSDDK